jgi:hypothetical protein
LLWLFCRLGLTDYLSELASNPDHPNLNLPPDYSSPFTRTTHPPHLLNMSTPFYLFFPLFSALLSFWPLTTSTNTHLCLLMKLLFYLWGSWSCLFRAQDSAWYTVSAQ